MSELKISIIGLGFVGGAILESLKLKINNNNIYVYDKYKDIGNLNSCIKSDITFLCLPTKYDNIKGEYNKESIYNICDILEKYNYNGIVVIKSTIEPETTDLLCDKYKNLKFIHNPEFLSAKTAFVDFHNQKHIVLGKSKNCDIKHLEILKKFYTDLYENSEISVCSSLESESMKIFCNCFYAVKIQFFTELYLLCQKNNCDFNLVKNIMIKNNWINSMHTNIPGTDGEISYGGLCFPKDTNALLKYMEKINTPHLVLENVIKERDQLRKDNENII